MRPASFVTLAACLSLAVFPHVVLAQSKPRTTPRSPATKTSVPSGAELIAALDGEDVPRALKLIQSGADPNAVNDDKSRTALGFAAALGNQPLVQALLDKGANVNPQGISGATPLWLGLASGKMEIARLLIEKGAAVNAGDSGDLNRMPLTMAAEQGWLPIVQLLLEKGAVVTFVSDDGYTALAAAARSGSLPVVQLLVDRGANVKTDATVMQYAVVGGSLPVVQFLLAHGRSLSETVKGTTMLHLAAIGNNPAIMQLVLDAGADKDAKNSEGETPLMVAADQRQVQAVEFLIGQKARLDITSDDFSTALDLVAKKNSLRDGDDTPRKAILDALTKAGAKPAPPSLWAAALHGELVSLKAMLDRGEDPNLADDRHNVPLVYAMHGNLNTEATRLVEALLSKGADPNARAGDGRTMVEIASDEGDDDAIALLRRFGAETPQLDLTEAVERGDTPLIDSLLAKNVVPDADALAYAIQRKDHPLLKRLLERGAKVNGPTHLRGFLFMTPPDSALSAATQDSDVEAVRLLLDHGADVNIHQKDGPTPLLAILSGKDEDIDAVVHLLVEHGADVRASTTGMTGGSVLARLAAAAPVKTLEYVLDRGAQGDINLTTSTTDDDTPSPLTLAVRTGHVENVRLLLDRGADPNRIEPLSHDTPLMELVQGQDAAWDNVMEPAGNEKENVPMARRVEIARLLIAHGARLDAVDTLGQNALQLAIVSHNPELAKVIRAAGSREATVAPGVRMDRAIYKGDIATVAALLKAGFGSNTPVSGEETPLYDAAFYGRYEIVQLLLKNGANVNVKSNLGYPIHAAASSGDTTIVQLLLARGATVDTDHEFAGTPLAEASEKGDIEMMRFLLHLGADPSARHSAKPGYPLQQALSKGGGDAVDLLLKAGADPNLGNPAHLTLFFGNLEALKKLVGAGAKIDTPDENGRTLLMQAAANGQAEIVTWLIARKADVNLKDSNGATALGYALERDKTECARLLRKAGAK